MSVSRTTRWTQGGYSVDYCATLFEKLLPNAGHAPQAKSLIFTALEDTKLCLSVEGHDINETIISRWSEAGGSVRVCETGHYSTTPLGLTENAVYDVNLTFGGEDLYSVDNNQDYIREFRVNETGYYLFNSTASPTQGFNASTTVQVLLKGSGCEESYRIGGAVRELGCIYHNLNRAYSSRMMVAYLETGRTYLLRYSSLGGGNIVFVNFTRWDLIKPVLGILGADGVTLDFTTTSATLYKTNDAGIDVTAMFVDFGSLLKYDVL